MIRKKIKIIIFVLLMTTIAAMVVISNYQSQILGEVNYRQSKPSSILQKKQFVAHARYFSAEHPNNSLSLYKKLVEDDLYQIIETDVLFTKDNIPVLSHETNIRDIAVDENGLPANIEIKNISYAELRKFNFETKSLQGGSKQISTLQELLIYLENKDVCIQLDLEKHVFSKEQYQILYKLVQKYNMLNKTIWEVNDRNFSTLTEIDQNLIIQLDHKWDKESIKNTNKNKAAMVILSKWFPDLKNIDYQDIIEFGHKNGFLMKCSIINDSTIAESLFKQGVDLIVTDQLK